MKWLTVLAVFLLATSVFAVPTDIPGQGNQTQGTNQTENGPDTAPKGNGLVRALNRSNIREAVKNRVRERIQEANQTRSKSRGVSQMIHNLQDIAAEQNQTLGQLISGVARKFNNSIQKVEQAENRIRNRGIIGQLRVMFFGGDEQAAGEIENQTAEMEEQLEELEDVAEEADEDTEEVLNQHAQEIRQRVEELKELAKEEKKKKGIFAFLFG